MSKQTFQTIDWKYVFQFQLEFKKYIDSERDQEKAKEDRQKKEETCLQKTRTNSFINYNCKLVIKLKFSVVVFRIFL